jgi:hypothetical protein
MTAGRSSRGSAPSQPTPTGSHRRRPHRPPDLPLAPTPPATEQPRSAAMRSACDCRRRRGGPQVRQERGRAVESIARSAPCGVAAPLPRGGLVGRGFCGRLAPRGGMTWTDASTRNGWGTRVAGVGTRVGTRVPTSVGGNGLGHRGTGRGPAGLRSLPAKQHAPKARPSPAKTVTVADRHGRLQVSIRLAGRAGRGEELRRTSLGPVHGLKVRRRRGSGPGPGQPGRRPARDQAPPGVGGACLAGA